MYAHGFIYALYGCIHLFIYDKLKMNCSFGTIIHEAQYVVNYSFMILNLFVFYYVFNDKNYNKLYKSILISLSIYILSIFIAVITHTSSPTYIEGIGYKGWFESGNSVSSILVLSTFIILSSILGIKNKKVKAYVFVILGLVGIYLTTMIGTRVGLLGFIIAILCFIASEVICKIIKKSKINKKILAILISILALLLVIVVVAGSVTIKRRKHLQTMECTIIDEEYGEVSNMTGDLTNIKNKILKNELDQGFMTYEQQMSIIDMAKYTKEHDISNTDTRMQQLIYHLALVKNQKNIAFVIFGNGYLINTNELVLEMEFISFVLNFGILRIYIIYDPFHWNMYKIYKYSAKEFEKN